MSAFTSGKGAKILGIITPIITITKIIILKILMRKNLHYLKT